MKRMKDMDTKEIIDRLIEDRGLNPKDRKLRREYPVELVLKAKRGDTKTLTELLKIGTHTSKPIPMFK